MGEIPVPIPNTMVKPQAADNTILETVWEGRWVPGLQKSTTVVHIDWSSTYLNLAISKRSCWNRDWFYQ